MSLTLACLGAISQYRSRSKRIGSTAELYDLQRRLVLAFSIDKDTYWGFHDTFDLWVEYTSVLGDLLDNGVRVLIYAGDADYICNWYGNEAVALDIPWSGKLNFNGAEYTEFVIDGEAFGQVRQAGNLTFLRMWNAPHDAPRLQPKASLELFRRGIAQLEMADGLKEVTDDTKTSGTYIAEPVSGQDMGTCPAPDGWSVQPGYPTTDTITSGASSVRPSFMRTIKNFLKGVWVGVGRLWWIVHRWLDN